MDSVALLLYFFLYVIPSKGISLTQEEVKQAKLEAHASCLETTGVSEDLVMDIKREGKFSNDENLKCYVKCVHDYLGLMADDGTMDYETIIAHIPEEYQVKYASRIRACGTIYGSDLCETAWLTIKCYGEGISQLPHP
uniref:Odorant-binding protein 13 n=1 Tax=Monochamus alternatus TaxID=192382 RepID=A0A1I9HZL6_MONAT|nr:odorant-binding protein 13 [Monochamus alternatus]